MENYSYIVIWVVIAVFFMWGAVYVIRGTKRKSGRWGLNIKVPERGGLNPLNILSEVKCPNCGHELPKVRVPRSLKQVLWGGWTCPNCGQEVDKWGSH